MKRSKASVGASSIAACGGVAPFEELESRKLFSVSLWGSTVVVDGSAGNDQIQVTMSSGPLFNFVNVAENGVTTGSFPASSVSAVQIAGNAGNDTIAIGSGIARTYIDGGAGYDTIFGGDGIDYISGGDQNDYIDGGWGNDNLDGWNGDDTVLGGEGDDTVSGWYGNDTLYGQGGNDTLRGHYDNDTLYGGTGADYMLGGFGDDTLDGEAGNDTILGEDGSDILTGGAGRDYLGGGNGNDFFNAHDDEVDTIDGGAGWDTASVDKKAWWEFWGVQDNYSNVENAFEP